MKISLLGPTYPYRGGIAHYTTLLYRELSGEHQVQFVSFSRQYPAFIFPGKSDRDPSQYPFKVANVEYLLDSLNPFSWYRTARHIADFNPDMTIIPWWVAFWAPQFWTIATLIQKHCSGKLGFICHNSLEHESAKWKSLAGKAVLRKADFIITHSTEETLQIKRSLPAGIKVVTAYHPTYAALCGPLPTCAEARNKLGVKTQHVLLFFGFIRPYKGLDILLNALVKVKDVCDVTLLVVGEFWKSKKEYSELINKLDIKHNVRLVDRYVPNEEVPLYFGAADIVVQPYRTVSGSGILQLAYGFGKPVIASNIGALAEVINDGENGRIVEVENVDRLTEAIIESLRPAELTKLTEGARQTARDFSWNHLARLLVAQAE